MPGRTPSSTAGMSSIRWQMPSCVYATDPQLLLSATGGSLWSSARCSGCKSRRLSSICNSCVCSSTGPPGALPLLRSSSTRCDGLSLICPTQAEALRNLRFLSCTIYWIECMVDHVHGDVEVEFRWKKCILAGHEAPKADLCIWSHWLQHGWHSFIRPSQKRLRCCRQLVTYSVAHTKASCSCSHSTTSRLRLVLYTCSPKNCNSTSCLTPNSEISMSACCTFCHLQQSRVTWLQEIAGQIRARAPHHVAAAAFAAWSHTAAASIAAKLSMQQAIGRMTHLRAAQVFAAWQLHAHEQRVKTAQLGKAMARLQRLRCSAVVFAWHRLTLQKKAVQGRLAKAVR